MTSSRAVVLFFAAEVATVGLNVVSASQSADPDSTAQSRVDMHLNLEVLKTLGLRIALTSEPQAVPEASEKPGYEYLRFTAIPLDFTSFDVAQSASLASQRVQVLGGVLLAGDKANLDLRGALLRPTTNPLKWDVESGAGAIWFQIDHAHVRSEQGSLRLSDANLTLSTAGARYLNHADLAGVVIGGIDLDLHAPVETVASREARSECEAPWPSSAEPAKIRLILMASNTDTKKPDTISFERCLRKDEHGQWGPCVFGKHDGFAVFAPDASLKNIGKSAVPWYPRLSGRHPPYDNDQHPFLFWNLYRLDPDGVLHQIATSGVKHAFFAVNAECGCQPGQVVYPKCVDTYSSYNNDSFDVLGPRNEVVPAKGIWGRCGSTVDPDCKSRRQSRPFVPEDMLRYRLAVPERALDTTIYPHSTFLFEYGYLIRDSDIPDGAVGYRIVNPENSPGAGPTIRWTLNPGALFNGLAANELEHLRSPGQQTMSRNISGEDGHVRLITTVSRTSDGAYHYQYAVINIDFATARVSGGGDRMTVSDAHGISSLSLPIASRSEVANVGDTTTDGSPGNRWKFERKSNQIGWSSSKNNELTWGRVMTFYFDSSEPPRPAVLTLHSIKQELRGETLIPK